MESDERPGVLRTSWLVGRVGHCGELLDYFGFGVEK